MATSGTTVFNPSRDDIITAALRACGVLQEGQLPNATQISDAGSALNVMLKYYAIKGWLLWLYQKISFPTVPLDSTYTIAPISAQITANRPLRISQAFIRDETTGFDTPLIILTKQEYELLSPKTQAGVPNSIYYDPQLTTGSFYLWPVPQDTTHTIYVVIQRQIEEVTTGAQTFDAPQEWFLPLKWNLASEIGPEYGVTERQQQRIDQRAQAYLQEITDFAVAEEPSVYFTPNPQQRN